MTEHRNSIKVQPSIDVRPLAVGIFVLAGVYLVGAAVALGAAWVMTGRIYLPREGHNPYHNYTWPEAMSLHWPVAYVFFLLLPLLLGAFAAAGILQYMAARPRGASRWLLIGGTALALIALGVNTQIGPALQNL
jgi:hypothetical protein